MPSSDLLHPLLRTRYSPQAFDPSRTLSDAELFSLLEAARWAPSAGNSQPWAFVVGRRGDPNHAIMVERLKGSTRVWAPQASVLIMNLCHILVEDTDWDYSEFAQYDLGQAVAHMTVQAAALGLSCHQFRAFDRDELTTAFEVAPHWLITSMTAIGLPVDEAPPRRERRAAAALHWRG